MFFTSYANFVFHFFKNKTRRRKSKTIVGEIPTIDFTLFLIFFAFKMGVLNEKMCKIIDIIKIINIFLNKKFLILIYIILD